MRYAHVYSFWPESGTIRPIILVVIILFLQETQQVCELVGFV